MECFQGMDTTIKCRDGRRNPILKNATKITIEGKTFILENFQDISRQKDAEEALISAKLAAETASKTKSEFLASMSHDLRTPLNAVIGYSDMLLEEAFGEVNDQQRRSLGHILASGKHLLEVINDILDLSKVESGKMELHYENFYIHDLLKNVGNMVSFLAKKKNISFSVFTQPESLCVSADKVRMKQILYNLVSNAIKFTQEDGHVRIDAYKRDDMLEISVSDNGIGISEEEQKKLFMPFYQVHSDTSRHYDGTGLGLSLVKKFVEMHDGDIILESETGKGTKFTITVPLKK
jgi:signal transduction histidine kinase